MLNTLEIPEIEFPEKLSFLIDTPARYKVLYGGRGGMKTETIARALIILCLQRKLRILCLRELQNSIDESVYETLKFAIIDMGLEHVFDIQKKKIICIQTGSEFIFRGLRYNINKLKSLARIDIAWIEEAVNVSKTSLDKLGPTIRGRHVDDPNGMGGPFGLGPEIWVSFNPELDTDEIYKRFVLKKLLYAPEYVKNERTGEMERYAIVIKTSWRDNKWLPDDLRKEIEVAKQADMDDYLHVWEGATKQSVDGAIYADEVRKVIFDGRRGKVLYDDSRPVHTFWDLGHNDHTAIWFIQRVGIEYNVINYFQDRLKKIPYYIKHLKDLGYIYGMHYLPHDADHETLASRSVLKIVNDSFPKTVRLVPRVAKKVIGIRAARQVFDLCNFDEENTAEGWQCLCRYKYDVDENGTFSQNPEHDEASHGADAFQTFALSLKSETEAKKPKTVGSNRSTINVLNSSDNSWMA